MSDTFEDPLNDLLCDIASAQGELLNKHSPSPEKKDVRRQSKKRAPAETKNEKTTTKIDPLRGALEPRYVRCGRPNCKCVKGQLHGPYYLRRWQHYGKRYSKYVKKGEVSATFDACLEYKRNKQETRELIRDINRTGNAMLKAMGEVLRSWKL
jgi:hypothetical protein